MMSSNSKLRSNLKISRFTRKLVPSESSIYKYTYALINSMVSPFKLQIKWPWLHIFLTSIPVISSMQFLPGILLVFVMEENIAIRGLTAFNKHSAS